jgi:hypothetical protein
MIRSLRRYPRMNMVKMRRKAQKYMYHLRTKSSHSKPKPHIKIKLSPNRSIQTRLKSFVVQNQNAAAWSFARKPVIKNTMTMRRQRIMRTHYLYTLSIERDLILRNRERIWLQVRRVISRWWSRVTNRIFSKFSNLNNSDHNKCKPCLPPWHSSTIPSIWSRSRSRIWTSWIGFSGRRRSRESGCADTERRRGKPKPCWGWAS